MVVILREVTHEELSLLLRFHHDLYVPEFPHPDERESIENVQECLRKKEDGWYGRNNYHVLLALEGEVPVGGVIGDYLDEPRVGVVEFLVVARNRRGHGLGRKLLTAIEMAMEADAARAGRTLAGLVAEINDPFRWIPYGDSVDPFVRAEIWHAWGFGRVDFPYVQPALSATQEPVRTLSLIAKPVDRTFRPGQARAIEASVVKLIVQEYMRWAMRMDRPEQNLEFRKMAAFLDACARRGQVIEIQSLGEYLAVADTLAFTTHEIEASEEDLLRQVEEVYSRSFRAGPIAVEPQTFRRALASRRHANRGYRHHLWALVNRVNGRVEGMTSFYSFHRVGFGGYLCLDGELRGHGRLRSVVSCVERQMVRDGLEPRGWLIECDPAVAATIRKFEKVGFRRLAVDYRQPVLPESSVGAAARPTLTLLYKALGADYAPQPHLDAEVFIAAIAAVFRFVYQIDSPESSGEYRSIASQARAWPGAAARWVAEGPAALGSWPSGSDG